MNKFFLKLSFFIVLVFVLFLGSFVFVPENQALAEETEEKIIVYFFYDHACPFCLAADRFLDIMQERYPQIIINRYESHNPRNLELVKRLHQEHQAEQYIGLVPMTFVGENFFLGFDDEFGVGRRIENAIREELNLPSLDPQNELDERNLIRIPFLGERDVAEYSLLALAIVLGFFDGFNICSLGALTLILGLVLTLKSKRKVLILGGLFILVTGVVYGFLIFLWHHFFSLLSAYMRSMQILVGFLALLGGAYFFRQFLRYKKQGLSCEIKKKGISEKLVEKLKNSFTEKSSIITMAGGVLVFAAIVTIIEFPCSAFLPVIFAGILAQAELATSIYLFYIFIFVLFYMLDEFIVFLVAVFTMRIWIASSRFVTWITLLASILLFLLSFYYLFGLF